MAGIYVPWLADAARLTGYPVVEVNGWKSRGHGGFRALEGVVGHHTADGPGEYPSLNIVTKGRSDLPGPLSNYGLARSGTVYVIAAGVCWHAGASLWAGFRDLNDEFLGIEAESKGTLDDWTAAQRDAYPRLVAASLYYMRRGSDRFAGHKEVCIPKGRKIDPAFWDLNTFRTRVAWLLADPLNRIPKNAPAATPAKEEDDLTPEQAKQLAEVHAMLTSIWGQLAGGGAKPGQFTGWPSFPEGSGKRLTVVDYLRQADVQLQKVLKALSK